MRYLLLIFTFLPVLIFGQVLPYGNSVVKKYGLAVTAYEGNDIENAAALFNDCIQLDSSCFEAYYGLGLIQFETEQFEKALSTCILGEKLRPFNAKLTSLKGKTLFRLGNFESAEELLRRSNLMGEDGIDNQQYLALCLEQTEKFEEALVIYDQLLAQAPKNFESNYNRGLLFATMELHEKALVDFENALEIKPKHSETCIQAASSCFEINLIDRARGYIFLGAKNATTEERTELYVLEGQYFAYKDDYEAAYESYTIAYERAPENALIMTYQAAALIDLKLYEKAIEKCNDALLIDPNLTVAYINRGIAFEMSRNTNNACLDWQQAFALGSQSAIDYLNSPVCDEK